MLEQRPAVAIRQRGDVLPRVVGEVHKHGYLHTDGCTSDILSTSVSAAHDHSVDVGFPFGGNHLEDVLDTFVLHGAIEARSDDHVAAFLHQPLHLRQDLRIVLGTLRQNHQLLVLRKLRHNLHGYSHHTHIVMQEVVARRVEGLVSLDTLGRTQFAEQGIDLVIGIVGDTSPCGRVAALLGRREHHRREIEQRDLWSLGQQRQPQLFGENLGVPGTASVNPSAEIVLWTDILEIADDTETLVSLQMLFALTVPV